MAGAALRHLKIYLKTAPLHLGSVKTVPQSGFVLHRYSRLLETHSPQYVHVQKPLHDQPKVSEQIFWLGSVYMWNTYRESIILMQKERGTERLTANQSWDLSQTRARPGVKTIRRSDQELQQGELENYKITS